MLGLLAALLLVQAAVYAIASYGVALHWSYLIVAAVTGLGATLVFIKGRADVRADMTPDRSIRNIKHDIATAKEHLT